MHASQQCRRASPGCSRLQTALCAPRWAEFSESRRASTLTPFASATALAPNAGLVAAASAFAPAGPAPGLRRASATRATSSGRPALSTLNMKVSPLTLSCFAYLACTRACALRMLSEAAPISALQPKRLCRGVKLHANAMYHLCVYT